MERVFYYNSVWFVLVDKLAFEMLRRVLTPTLLKLRSIKTVGKPLPPFGAAKMSPDGKAT